MSTPDPSPRGGAPDRDGKAAQGTDTPPRHEMPFMIEDCGWLTRALLRVGGFHTKWIDNNADAAKFAAQGGILLLIPAIAFGAVLVSAWAVNHGNRFNYWFIWVLAGLWALIVFCVDRWITTSIDYGDLLTGPRSPLRRVWDTTWFYLARILMAVVIGYIISESVCLGVFHTAIDRELKTIQSENVTNYKETAEAEYQKDIDDADLNLSKAREAQVTADTARRDAYNLWQGEINGTGGTGDVGPSPPDARCVLPYDVRPICAESNASHDLSVKTEAATAAGETVTQAQNVLDGLNFNSTKAISDKVAVYEAANAADTNVATRHKALVRLAFNDWGYLWWWLVITIAVLVVDLVPLMFKLFGPHSRYLENARGDASGMRASTEIGRIAGDQKLAAAQHNLDERKHRNRMAALTRKHEYGLADAAAEDAARRTREKLRQQRDDSGTAADLAEYYLKSAFAHLKDRSRRWRESTTSTRPYTAPPSDAPRQEPKDDDVAGDEPTPTPQPAPPRRDGLVPPVPRPDRPRSGYGLRYGEIFPDDQIVDNPLDMHWRIVDSSWKEVNGGNLLLAIDADHPDNGVEYVVKVYRRPQELIRRDRAQGRAELHATPVGKPKNDYVAYVYFAGVFEDNMVIVTRLYPYTLNTFQTDRVRDPQGSDFTLRRVLKIAEQILSALAWSWTRRDDPAFDAGRVHLDIKPANIGIDEEGTPKIIDWALSRSLDAADHTSSRLPLRSPYYAPPEQGSPNVLWPTHLVAADVYAWAATLYEMITGKPPHRLEAEQRGIRLEDLIPGSPALEGYHALRSQLPPPVSKWAPFVPPTLDGLLEKCLDPLPEKRHTVPKDNSLSARQAAAADTAQELMTWLQLAQRDAETLQPRGVLPADEHVGSFTRFVQPRPHQQHQHMAGDVNQQAQQQHSPPPPHPIVNTDDDPDAAPRTPTPTP